MSSPCTYYFSLFQRLPSYGTEYLVGSMRCDRERRSGFANARFMKGRIASREDDCPQTKFVEFCSGHRVVRWPVRVSAAEPAVSRASGRTSCGPSIDFDLSGVTTTSPMYFVFSCKDFVLLCCLFAAAALLIVLLPGRRRVCIGWAANAEVDSCLKRDHRALGFRRTGTAHWLPSGTLRRCDWVAKS